MKKFLLLSLIILFTAGFVFASAAPELNQETANTVWFTDSCGREVELPASITKVAPSGVVATMFLSCVAPEYMCNVNSSFSESQMAYLPKEIENLPATGQLYGSKATLNIEEIIATGAQVIIDLGDYKPSIAEDLDALQKQTGMPCIFLEANLENMAEAFRALGTVLDGKKERAEQMALFVEKTMAMAKENSAKVKENEVVSIMFSSGLDGLGTNADGSSQAQVIPLIGAKNAIVVSNVTSKGGGNIINMEQLFNFDPDLIIFGPDSIYEELSNKEKAYDTWGSLKAVQDGLFYEIPGLPYNWMGNPPSVNMVLGIWWLGNLVYPQYYDYDIVQIAKDFYELFWNCKLEISQVEEMLSKSSLRK